MLSGWLVCLWLLSGWRVLPGLLLGLGLLWRAVLAGLLRRATFSGLPRLRVLLGVSFRPGPGLWRSVLPWTRAGLGLLLWWLVLPWTRAGLGLLLWRLVLPWRAVLSGLSRFRGRLGLSRLRVGRLLGSRVRFLLVL